MLPETCGLSFTKMMRSLALLLCVLAAVGATHNYDHLEFARLTLRGEADQHLLQELIETGQVDPTRRLSENVAELLLTTEKVRELKKLGMVLETVLDGHAITNLARSQTSRNGSTEMDWISYHTLDEINAFVDDLAAQYPDVATVGVLGSSWDGRDIKMITLTTDTRPDSPIVLVDAGIHAREWIAPAVGSYILNQIAQDTERLSQATYVFIPVLNVDGYQFAWDENRLWRKTRSQRDGESCYGTDPNRNFDFHWMEIGASSHSCSETYGGIEAASENLTKALMQYMTANSENIKAYITLHSYSQLFLAPYGYTTDAPENMDELNRVAKAATEALTAVHGTVYEYGSASTVLYSNSGSSRDYAAGQHGIPYVFTIELRDQGTYGFLLPEDQISDTCEETYEAYKVIVQAVLDSSV